MKKTALVLIFMLVCATVVAEYPWQPEARDEERERLLELLVLKELLHPLKKGIADKVKEIVVEQLGVDGHQVMGAAHFIDDLGADSLDTVELIMALEEEFAVEISDEDAEQLQTVQQAIDYIMSKIN